MLMARAGENPATRARLEETKMARKKHGRPEVQNDPVDFDFEQDASIDEDALDVEWIRLPQIYSRYAKLLAEAETKVNLLDEMVKVRRSSLILRAMEVPNVLGADVKPTAQAIEAYYRTHSTHIELKQQWMEATRVASMCRNAIFSMQLKKVALENLVRLCLGEYFAAPSIPRDLSTAIEKRRTENKRDVRRRIRTRMGGGA